MVKAKGKGGLGRGLDALISNNAPLMEEKEVAEKVVVLPISEVEANLNQPRRFFDDEALRDLATSIASEGVLQPILVRVKDIGGYEIIAGERRYRASILAGLAEIPAIIKNFDDEKTLSIALIENVQREDLGIMEEAITYKKLIDTYGYNQQKLAKIIGKSRVYISNTMRLLDLSDDIIQLIEEGVITAGHGRALLMVKDKRLREHLASRVVREGLSVRQTEEVAQKIEAEKKEVAKEKPATVEDLVLSKLETRLSERVATKVKIGKKKIEIDYYSDDDLERIVNLLGVDMDL